MQHEWLKKNEHTAQRNCLHHWPVRKKIIALTNSSTQAPPQRSNSPEMGHLSTNGVEKERSKLRTVINYRYNNLQNYINIILEDLNGDTQFSVINQSIFLSILSSQ